MPTLHPNANDLTGDKYGRLTVLSFTGERECRDLVWRCRCDCGRTTTGRSSKLRSGDKVSCGCASIEDLSGQTFGRLTALWPTSGRRRGRVVWQCRCSCDELMKVDSEFLSGGHRTSCGCKKRDDLHGQVFGRLVAIKPTGDRNHNREVVWLCRCDCGEATVASTGQLNCGGVRSCGCLQREKAQSLMTTHGLSATKEYKNWKQRKRKDLQKTLDSQWTFEMEQALRSCQTSCVVCGSRDDLCVDHVRPLSAGHGLKPGNAAILCRTCNTSKGDKRLHELDDKTKSAVVSAAESFKDHWNRTLSGG